MRDKASLIIGQGIVWPLASVMKPDEYVVSFHGLTSVIDGQQASGEERARKQGQKDARGDFSPIDRLAIAPATIASAAMFSGKHVNSSLVRAHTV